MMDRVRDGNIKIVPNVSITGSGSNSGVMDSLMGLLVEQKIAGQENAESAKLLGQSKNDGKRQDILDVQELLDS